QYKQRKTFKTASGNSQLGIVIYVFNICYVPMKENIVLQVEIFNYFLNLSFIFSSSIKMKFRIGDFINYLFEHSNGTFVLFVFRKSCNIDSGINFSLFHLDFIWIFFHMMRDCV